jgi:hypothetical protein
VTAFPEDADATNEKVDPPKVLSGISVKETVWSFLEITIDVAALVEDPYVALPE